MSWAKQTKLWRTKLWGTIKLVLLVCLATHSSKIHAERLPVKIYTTADGLARDQISRIVQDSHGFLWFCTVEGLSRFDGYRFTNYTTADGLPSGTVTDFLETRDGTFLVATANGVCRFNPRGAPVFTTWRPAEPGAEVINELIEDHAGRIWCGTNAGLYWIDTTTSAWSFHFVDLGLPRENVDSWLVESLIEDATAQRRGELDIEGHPNRSGNDGTITRFGWKAQNKSITIFAGEAYNVEMGITNEAFPTATEEDPGCQGPQKPEPNDVIRTSRTDPDNQAFNNPLHILPDWQQFQLMMRFTDGPAPDPNPSASAQKGRVVFDQIGCALCHTPQMQTAPVMLSQVLQDRPVNLFSDLLLHHMGATLADNILQGQAGPDEFRTTPLWGVGQRIFFLHDGRTSDLLGAIAAHFSAPTSPNPRRRDPAYLRPRPTASYKNSINYRPQISKQFLTSYVRCKESEQSGYPVFEFLDFSRPEMARDVVTLHNVPPLFRYEKPAD